jgi:hypothetical protein
MDNHGLLKQINVSLVHNLTKFLNCIISKSNIILEPDINSLSKKRKKQSKKLKKRNTKKNTEMLKVFYYCWSCYWFLIASKISFKIGDMEHLGISLRLLVSFVILDFYGVALKGGEILD